MIKIDNNFIVEVEKSKDNKKIIRLFNENRSIYLGSRYSVSRDIESIREFINKYYDYNIIIIGLGSGEYIEQISECIRDEIKLIILEPNVEIYNMYIENNNFDFENIIILPLTQEYMKLISLQLSTIALKAFKVYEYPNYRNIYIEEIRKVYSLIVDTVRDRVIGRNTKIFFSKLWFESTVSNLKYLYKSKAVNSLKDIYKNRPAVIVSAGPSLSKNIKQLEQFESKAVILTGGRTLRTLMNEGTNPDFLSIVDAHELSYELVDGIIDKTNAVLAHSEILPTKVLDSYKGQRIFFPYASWINEIVENPKYNFTYTSVAHTCTKLAMYMGCNPIIFIGQDLAYTDDKVHAENAEFVQEKYKDKEDISKVADESSPYVEDIYGNMVRTSMTLNLFRQHFEKIIEENPQYRFINSTEGGANIKGTEIRRLIDNIDVFNEVSDKSIVTIDYNNMREVITKNNVYEILNKSINYLIELIEKLNEAVKHNEMYYNHFIRKNKVLKSSLKILDEADQKIKNMPNDIKFIEYLFAKTIDTVLYNPMYQILNDDTEINKANKIYKKSKVLYENLLKEAKYALKYIKNEIEDIRRDE